MIQLITCKYCGVVMNLLRLRENASATNHSNATYFAAGNKEMWQCKVCNTRNEVTSGEIFEVRER